MYLTPSGWGQGSRKNDFQPVVEVSAPENAVLCVRKSEYLGSAYSQMQKSTKETPLVDDAAYIELLKTKFGPPPL